ncbi:MAG: hypothetical protein HYT80_07265 [Euryarchaeota archaeon]|nr:hypothetical protein [Euryarchaeota archaeon]
MFNDVTWAKGSLATGDKLSVTFSYEKRSSSHWYCDDVGLNPIQMHWERAEDVEDNKAEGDCLSGGQNTPSAEPQTIPYTKGQQLRSFLNTGPAQNLATGGDFGTFALAWHQDFDIWFSVFYWERAPEGYSALPDA